MGRLKGAAAWRGNAGTGMTQRAQRKCGSERRKRRSCAENAEKYPKKLGFETACNASPSSFPRRRESMPTHAQNVDSRLRGNDSGRRVGDLSHSRQSIRKRCCTAWVTACSLTHPAKPKPALMRVAGQKRLERRMGAGCRCCCGFVWVGMNVQCGGGRSGRRVGDL